MYEARESTMDSSQPATGGVGACQVAVGIVLVVGNIFTKIPDVTCLVLRKVIKGVFDPQAALKSTVAHGCCLNAHEGRPGSNRC